MTKEEIKKLDEKASKLGKLNPQEIQYIKALMSIITDIEEINEDRIEEEIEEIIPIWISELINEDGTKGAYWTKSETSEVARNNGIDFYNITEDDWYMAMNMVYSDYSDIAKKYGVDSVSFYVDLAKQWLWDKDTIQGEDKLLKYYMFIADC